MGQSQGKIACVKILHYIFGFDILAVIKWKGDDTMDTLEAIMTRKSVRNFTDQAISDEALDTILKAGMSGPSCVNARDWSFVVTRDAELLKKMADANGRPADPLRGAALGILVLGDLERAFKLAPDYWIIDGSIAAQNMILAAHAMGIGSVWLGTYPQMERVEAQRKLLGLPDTVIPHSILAFGYPDSSKETISGDTRNDRYESNRIHMDKW